jgi:hypothetical protein
MQLINYEATNLRLGHVYIIRALDLINYFTGGYLLIPAEVRENFLC